MYYIWIFLMFIIQSNRGEDLLPQLALNVANISNLNVLTNAPANILTSLKATPGILSKKKCQEFYPPKTGISGGEESLPKEFPHMAIIGFGEEDDIHWECGGSLISLNYVLTAAHCLNSRQVGPAKWVRLGDLDLSTDEDDASPQNFSVKRSVAHPLFKPPVKYHDIGLLELDHPITMTQYVSPACLHTEREISEETMVATGWGMTDFVGSASSYLLKAQLDYVPHDKCSNTFKKMSAKVLPDGIVNDWQICAGGNGKDTCQGDSGGPLQVNNTQRTFVINVHTIIGITSLGRACGLSHTPGIYTRISHYVPWIESVVWPNETDISKNT